MPTHQPPNSPAPNSEPTGYRTKWDTENPTYFWHIHLDKNNPTNKPNVEYLTGYSKVRFNQEAQDKAYVLKRKCGMIYNYGYFKKMTRTEIYHNVDPLLNRSRAPKILTLYPTHYEIHEIYFDRLQKFIMPWLEMMYERVRKGEGITDIMPQARKGKDKDFYINPDNYDFANVGQLYTHLASLNSWGHAPGAIENFARTVRSRKGW